MYIVCGSHIVAHHLLHRIREAMAHVGLQGAIDGRYDRWIYLAVVLLLGFVAMYFLRWLTALVMKRIAAHRGAAFVAELYKSQFIPQLLWLIPPVSVHVMLPFAFAGILLSYMQRLCSIVVVCVVVGATNRLITVLWNAFYRRSRMHDRPMKGILQIVHGVCIAVGCIVSVSVLIDRSPAVLITGLGAFAAVLMLIFKDTILGFVAGIQLAQYDMVRNDDWITIPGTIVDGIVVDVSLNTVKVRNYDNTIVMLPPYTLVSQPLQNWRGMKESGGRRIMQSVVIDMDSVQFCTDKFVAGLRRHTIVADFIDKNGIEIVNPAAQPQPIEALSTHTASTNLGLFRLYLLHYLMQHPDIQHSGYTLLVRTLQPEVNGIPLQVYCFTNTTHWESYEIIQSQLMEYILAILPLFGLYAFQNASAHDYIEQALISQGHLPDTGGE
ncbi:MAG: mechanosensitive ion channel [Bacteroidaceae bacterium]|nr:mechanosensitive ion channel [Bacteroidales bacterium]MBQ2979880.1 mechanosensitive ion channel [Bacteroidaceae bacterium]